MTIDERLNELLNLVQERGVKANGEVWEPPIAVLLMFGRALGMSQKEALEGVDESELRGWPPDDSQ